MEGLPRWSCAPGTRALRRASFDGRTSTNMSALPGEGKQASLGGTFIETCHSMRAVEDQSAPIPEERTNKLGRVIWKNMDRSMRAVQDHLAYAFTPLLDRPLHPQEHLQPEGSRIIGFHVVISARMVTCG